MADRYLVVSADGHAGPPQPGYRDHWYWRRHCYVAATFMSRAEAELRAAMGVDRVLWGSDFPHHYPGMGLR